jgi:hypothetical protein
MAQQTWTPIAVAAGVYALPAAGCAVRSRKGRVVPYQNYQGGVADGSALGPIIVLSPADGSLLDADVETARFTPITAVFPVQLGQQPIVYVVIGTLSWTIYSPTAGANSTPGFVPFFSEHSSAQQVGTTLLGAPIWSFSVLPNGGWWRSGFNIMFCSGAVLADP